MSNLAKMTLVEHQAKLLATEHRQSDPKISKVYWFPCKNEVRLVEFHYAIPANDDGEVHPFFFRPSPAQDLPVSSAIALIRPNEFRKLQLPPEWGCWDSAVELFVE